MSDDTYSIPNPDGSQAARIEEAAEAAGQSFHEYVDTAVEFRLQAENGDEWAELLAEDDDDG